MGLNLGSVLRTLTGGSQNQQTATSTGSSTGSSFGQSFGGSNSFLYGPQSQGLNQLYGNAGNLFNQYQNNPQSLIAGFTQPQVQGQQQALDTASGPLSQLAGQGNQAFGQALNVDPSQSPYYQSALQSSFNPFVRNFLQSILPGIRSEAVGVGQAGSSRQGIAQGLASQGLLQQLGDITSNTANNAYNTGIQSRLSALGLLPQIQQSNLLPSNVYQQIGQQQQAQNQQNLNAPFALGQTYQGLLGAPITLQQAYNQAINSSQNQSQNQSYSQGTGTSQGGLFQSLGSLGGILGGG